jgi:beta-glucosidase
MATYPAIDGVPAHASEWILTHILRDELAFQGLVLSEGGGIGTLVYEGLARNGQEAGALALRAGVDVGISYESGYMQDMAKSIEQGLVPETLLDRAVRRILRMKFALGLFENPLVDAGRAEQTVHTAKHQELALQAAREGIVLLRNEGNLLPLDKSIDAIAVIGPNARNQLGDYVSLTVLQDVVTVLEGIKAAVSPGTTVEYVRGCDVVGTGHDEITKAREAARRAKVAVVVVGENEWRSPGRTGTDGEGYDAATLELTGRQLDLVKAVRETGTPTVVVLINGRPLAIPWIAENIPAVVEAWLPGEKGGQAVAEVLFGDCNPSGRLAVTVPRHAGQLPVYYNSRPSKTYWTEHGWGKPYVDMAPTPLYEFGYGLSYTEFEYSNLKDRRRRKHGACQCRYQEHREPSRHGGCSTLYSRCDQHRGDAHEGAARLRESHAATGRGKDRQLYAATRASRFAGPPPRMDSRARLLRNPAQPFLAGHPIERCVRSCGSGGTGQIGTSLPPCAVACEARQSPTPAVEIASSQGSSQ